MDNPASRASAIELSVSRFDDGTFVERLRTMVAVPTESHPPRKEELERYCHEVIGPMVAEMGFTFEVLANPEAGHGPILVAQRIEDPELPTVLLYGHGDVVRAMPERWRKDLDPWTLTIEGDKIYGRGVVDNKGQHLLAMESLRAVLDNRAGKLGFNAKIMIETGEEAGSPGLKAFLAQNRERCAADVFIALDGPRQSLSVPDISLGTRGGIGIDLVVDLRSHSHHSGHWGGVLKDAGVVLAHAIANIISIDGRILVPGWTPKEVPESVRKASRAVVFEDLPGAPVGEPGWGEPGLSRAERIYIWSSAIVLASVSGQPENPVPAVNGFAKARLQLRHTVDVDAQQVLPALQAHLEKMGLTDVKASIVTDRDWFPPSRTDPENEWVQCVARSMQKTSGQTPNMIPNIGASGPSEFFKENLGTPIMWIPHSYGGCNQHGPDEHGLGSLFREGLSLMTGVFWDFGEQSPGKTNRG